MESCLGKKEGGALSACQVSTWFAVGDGCVGQGISETGWGLVREIRIQFWASLK